MTKKITGAGKRPVRRISTKRDYERASVVVKQLSDDTGADSAAELRLQALLREMDSFDAMDDTTGADVFEDYEHSGPRRRWSDDAPGAE